MISLARSQRQSQFHCFKTELNGKNQNKKNENSVIQNKYREHECLWRQNKFRSKNSLRFCESWSKKRRVAKWHIRAEFHHHRNHPASHLYNVHAGHIAHDSTVLLCSYTRICTITFHYTVRCMCIIRTIRYCLTYQITPFKLLKVNRKFSLCIILSSIPCTISVGTTLWVLRPHIQTIWCARSYCCEYKKFRFNLCNFLSYTNKNCASHMLHWLQ